MEASLSYFCIINPRSGGGRGRIVAQQLQQLFASGEARGCVEEFDPSRLAEHVASACSYDRLLVGGGDGTIAAVLAQLVDLPQAPAVGILPLGTANDLAREYEIDLALAACHASEMLAYYRQAELCKLQLWRCIASSGKAYIFSNYLSFGFDAAVVDTFSQWRDLAFVRRFCSSKYCNRALYGLAALRHSFHFVDPQRFKVVVDGKTVNFQSRRVRSVLLANIKCIMGLGVSQRAGRADDQLLELVEVTSLLDYVRMVFRAVSGLSFLSREKVLAVGSRIEVFSHSASLQIDGESCLVVSEAHYRVEPVGELQIFTPRR